MKPSFPEVHAKVADFFPSVAEVNISLHEIFFNLVWCLQCVTAKVFSYP